MARRPLALLAFGLLGLAIGACGDTTHSISPSAATTAGSASVAKSSSVGSNRHYLNDGDGDENGDSDNDNNADNDNDRSTDYKPSETGYRDKDDSAIVGFGHSASAADAQTLTAAVKRYYTTAAAGNGASACGQIEPSLSKSVAEDYGQPPGPVALRGKTCAVVMSKFFKQEHRQLVAALSSFAVTGVRVEGNQARVLLGSPTAPAAYVMMLHDKGAWKITELLGTPLP